ncbi:MAG: hypothetical protein IJD60_01860 [Clostridia bacterium]|nr:hypothetical protein [Clostridia bacterium]
MADLTAHALRDAARDAMTSSGARGFMRFAKQGNALLATDAIRRAPDGGRALEQALSAQGFVCSQSRGLLHIAPGDECVRALVRHIPPLQICWENKLHPAQALAARWAAQPPMPFTEAGRQLVMDTLRLTGLPGCNVMEELGALRAQAAVMLRTGDRSGMYEAGRVLSEWCLREE